jgi:LysR family transcriptional regulator, transcriptional activator of the cysJI operon
MHVETLKTFCDLVETASFSKAARLNLVSQSAVSQQLCTLEQRYGRKLLERGHGLPARPTDAGKLLYVESKAILERFGALEQLLHRRPEVATGTVRLATVYSVGLHALPPHVKHFLRAYPQANVRIEYLRTDKVYEACIAGTIDLGIVAQPPRRPQLEIIPLESDELVLACGPEHALARRRRLTLPRLQALQFVAFDRDVPTRKAIDRLLRKHGVSLNIVTEFDNVETIKRSVEAGLGVSILPENTLKNEVKAKTLVARRFGDGPFFRSVGIIRRRGRELLPTAQAFLDLLRTEMGAGRH